MAKRRYSARFKFQVVMEVLRGQRQMGQIARAYGVHPITLGLWKKEFIEHGAEVFGRGESVRGYEQRIRDLERLLEQKEVEIALLKNFWGRTESGAKDGVGDSTRRGLRGEPDVGRTGAEQGHVALPPAAEMSVCPEVRAVARHAVADRPPASALWVSEGGR